jgi:hypothetical protein
MRVSINQPAYLPWLGYFHRIAISDLHVVLDQVQFEKNSVTNRNKIRTAGGWNWLTVPVKTKGRFGALEINNLEIDNTTNWAGKHWKSICLNYGKAAFFKRYASFLESIYVHPCEQLTALTDSINNHFLREVLGIPTPLLYGSELRPEGKKDELVLNICRQVGATTYISGPFGRDYLDEEKFRAAGISIEYHDYAHPEYRQYYQPFEPYLSTLDLIMNCGDESLDVMKSGQTRKTN